MAQRTQRLTEAARRSLPEGTFVVGAGLGILGLAAYGFQILAFRALTKGDYAALNGLWVFMFIVAPGFFLPLEQEVGRAVAHRRAQGIGGGPVVRRAAVVGFALAAALALISIAAAVGTPFVDRLFHGRDALIPCLVLALFAYFVEHLTRGTLSGNGRFGPYGMILAAEGIIRLLPVIVLAGAGVDQPLYYGLALALPPFFASAVALRHQHGLLDDGPEAPLSELSTKIGYLLFGSLFAQTLGYAPFLGAQLLAETKGEREAVANFLVGFFIARIPVLLFQAVQAALLPKLAGLAGAGRHDDFRTGLRKLVLVVIGIGVVGVVGGGTIGPAIGEILFGDKFTLGHRDLALLAAGSGLFILALTLAQGLIALMGHARVLVAWVVGIVVFVAVTAVAADHLFLRVEIGFLTGAAASVVIMAALLVQALRAGVPEDALASLAEQIEHEPLEI